MRFDQSVPVVFSNKQANYVAIESCFRKSSRSASSSELYSSSLMTLRLRFFRFRLKRCQSLRKCSRCSLAVSKPVSHVEHLNFYYM